MKNSVNLPISAMLFMAGGLLLTTARAWAADQPASRVSAPPSAQSDALAFNDTSKSIVTRVSGGTRGIGGAPDVFLLVSAKPGRTLNTKPTIYWYLTDDTEADIELLVTEPGQTAPICRPKTLTGAKKGLHATSLADCEKGLTPGKLYKVTIAVHDDPDDPSVDPFSMGFIECVTHQSIDDTPAAYAQAGLWYDALDSLCKAIDRDLQNPHLRNQRISLLQQQHVFLTFSPAPQYLKVPGVDAGRASAADREKKILDKIAQQDQSEVRTSADKH